MPVNTHPKFFHELPIGVNLYRYINFEKFQSLIKKSSLFFCKVSAFEDKWEGTYPLSELKYRKDESYWIERELNQTSEKDIDNIVTNKMKDINGGYENFKDIVFVNCWMHDTKESYAMWKLYAEKEGGVLIKSSYERIYSTLNQNPYLNFTMSRVFYIDYENDYLYKGVEKLYEISEETRMHLCSACITDPFLHKRKHFEHEKEYRIILDIPPPQNIKREGNGIFVEIDLSILIDEIILPPNCNNELEKKLNQS